MNYTKPEIIKIELFDPKTFISCSPPEYNDDDLGGSNNSNGSWNDQ